MKTHAKRIDGAAHDVILFYLRPASWERHFDFQGVELRQSTRLESSRRNALRAACV